MSPRDLTLYRQLMAAATQHADRVTSALVTSRQRRRAELDEVSVRYEPIRVSEALKKMAALAVPTAYGLAEIFGRLDTAAGLGAHTVAAAMVLDIMVGAPLIAAIALMSHHSHIGHRPRFYEYHWLTAASLLLGVAVGQARDLTGWTTLVLAIVATLGSGVIAWLLHRDAVLRFNEAAYPVRLERFAAADSELAAWKSKGRCQFINERQREIVDCLQGHRNITIGEPLPTEATKPDSSVRIIDNAGVRHG